uniref:Uncharacterized protein n=1 Tax=Craspedostauros australis TaxID=1486917 RepID=A0A7R9ZR54_9STRA
MLMETIFLNNEGVEHMTNSYTKAMHSFTLALALLQALLKRECIAEKNAAKKSTKSPVPSAPSTSMDASNDDMDIDIDGDCDSSDRITETTIHENSDIDNDSTDDSGSGTDGHDQEHMDDKMDAMASNAASTLPQGEPTNIIHIVPSVVISPSSSSPSAHTANGGQHETFYVVRHPIMFSAEHAIRSVDTLRTYSASVIFNIALLYQVQAVAIRSEELMERSRSMYNKVLQCQATDCRPCDLPAHIASASFVLGVAATNNLTYVNHYFGCQEAILNCINYLDFLLKYPSCSATLIAVMGVETVKELHLNVCCFEGSAVCAIGTAAA